MAPGRDTIKHSEDLGDVRVALKEFLLQVNDT